VRRAFLLGLTTIVPLAQMALAPSSVPDWRRGCRSAFDLDSSDLSRTIIRMVDATPDLPWSCALAIS
jgi:ABC-2 type transport system permease protein